MPMYITLALPSLDTPPLLTRPTPKSYSQTGPRLSVLSTFSPSHRDYSTSSRLSEPWATPLFPAYPPSPSFTSFPHPRGDHLNFILTSTWAPWPLSVWPPTLPQSDHLSASPPSFRRMTTAEARGTAGETGASPQLGEPSSAQASELSFGFHLSCISYLSLSSFSSSQAPTPLNISASSRTSWGWSYLPCRLLWRMTGMHINGLAHCRSFICIAHLLPLFWHPTPSAFPSL